MTTTKIKHFICNKCCRTVKPSQVIVINKKLVCPFCFRTLETDKSKVDFVDKLKKLWRKITRKKGDTMKINTIKTFSYKDNTLKLNESTLKYKGEVDNEVMESLVSKRAYASALLYLNSKCILESINNEKVTKQKLSSYLDECNKILQKRSKFVENVDARPLCNINKLEIMEDSKNIYRGKAGKMYVELTEDSYEEPFFLSIEEALYNAGFDVQRFSEAGVLTQNLGWCVSNSEGEVQLQCNGTYLGEEVEGTQTTDVAEKKDQDLGIIKQKKTSKFIANESTFKVPYNHCFKGFTLTEDGKYTRGNYVLINEDGKIRAINKSRLEEATTDKYNNKIFSYEEAEQVMKKLINRLNTNFDEIYGYDFDFRIEEMTDDDEYAMIELFDKNENFDYEDKNYEKVNKIVKDVFGSNAYIEPENSVIMIIAGCYVK